MASFFPALRGLSNKSLAPSRGVETKAVFGTGIYGSYSGGARYFGLEGRADAWDMDRVITDGYERLVWVFKSVEWISGHQSRLPFRIGRNIGENDEEVMEEHPLYRVLNKRANPMETGRQFRKRLSAQVLLSKRGAFVEVTKSRRGQITRLDLLPPDRVRPIADTNGDYVDYFEFTARTGQLRNIDPERIRWIREPHPTDPFSGTTPLEAAGISIELDHLSRLYNVSFIKNDGRPGGIVGVDTNTLDDDEMDRIESRFKPGANAAGEIVVIGTGEGGINYIDTTTRPRDMAYAETAANSKMEILSAFGLDESVVGSVAGRTFDNAEQALYNAWTEVEVPHLDLIASAFDGDVGEDWDPFIDTSTVEVLEMPRRRARQEALTEWNSGLRSLDEYRPLAGLDPINSPFSRALWISPQKAPVAAKQEDEAALGIGDQAAQPPGAPGAPAPATAPTGHEAADAVAQARAINALPPDPMSAAGAVAAAREGGDQMHEPGDAAAAVQEARSPEAMETKALDTKTAPAPVEFAPDDSRQQAATLAAQAALDALLARQANIIATKVASPKTRKGTRFWQPESNTDTRGGAEPLDVSRAVDEEKWAAEVQSTLQPIVEQQATDSGADFLAVLAAAGVLATGSDTYAPEARQAATGLILAVLEIAAESMRHLMTGLFNDLVTEAMVATDISDVVASVQSYYGGHAAEWSRELAEFIGHTVTVGAVDAAAGSLIGLPGTGNLTADPDIVRTWRTKADDRVRPSHVAAEGKQRAVGDPFVLDGAAVRFPGDPLAPIAETANCRCRLWYRVTPGARFLTAPLPQEVAA